MERNIYILLNLMKSVASNLKCQMSHTIIIHHCVRVIRTNKNIILRWMSIKVILSHTISIYLNTTPNWLTQQKCHCKNALSLKQTKKKRKDKKTTQKKKQIWVVNFKSHSPQSHMHRQSFSVIAAKSKSIQYLNKIGDFQFIFYTVE